MKILFNILFVLIILSQDLIAAEKKDCKEFKKLSKEYLLCLAGNLKIVTIKTSDKVKKDTTTSANIVKKDASSVADKVKNNTEKLIKKSKDTLKANNK